MAEKQDRRQDNGDQQSPFNMNNGRRWLPFLIPLLFLLPFMGGMFGQTNQPNVSYTTFLDQVEQDNVRELVLSGDRIAGQFRRSVSVEGNQQVQDFVTFVPSSGDPDLIDQLTDRGIDVYTRPARDNVSPLGFFANLLPFLLLVWIGMAVFRNMRSQGGNIFSVGQNQAKLYDKRSHVETTFEDVAGLHGVKEEVIELVDYLKHPEKYEHLGARTPKGVLLVGPPGTGKTLLARAIAGEAEAPFYSMSGSDFMEMFVGVGASRVRNLFKDAKKRAPSIIFIDELDSIGRHRGAGLGGGHDEREQTLNQLLAELDGFEQTEAVIVLAATNRPDILDPALLRPGRFDRRVTTNLPSVRDRAEILKLHARERPLSDDVNLEDIAKGTPGFTGADLQNLLNEGSLIAARQQKKRIEAVDLDEARDKVLLGLERRNLTVSPEERKIVAYHEAGHAAAAALLPKTDPLLKVTIVPRDRAMGVTQQLPDAEKYLYDKPYLFDRLAVLLAGRASEILTFETVTSGAQSDLEQATKLARKMVSDWGMSDAIGAFSAGGEKQNVFLGEELSKRKEYSEATAQEIDKEIRSLLGEAERRVSSLLKEHHDGLKDVAEKLLEKEELSGEEVVELLGMTPKEAKGDGEVAEADE
ncbi:MAG: ATP-dependent zinc metalloprotease FtsH [Spirochaetaceae bacterium]